LFGNRGMSKTGTGGSSISEIKGKKESRWFFDFRMSEKPTLVLECQESETSSSLMVEINQEPEVL